VSRIDGRQQRHVLFRVAGREARPARRLVHHPPRSQTARDQLRELRPAESAELRQ
jgi:hypothetical protein